jgi:hypothetical protein
VAAVPKVPPHKLKKKTGSESYPRASFRIIDLETLDFFVGYILILGIIFI